MNNYWRAIICLGVLVIGLILYIIFGKVGPGNGTDGEKSARDSINVLIKDRLDIEKRIASLNTSYDSLLREKQTVKNFYHEKYKFIYSASPDQLDSIIRSAAGIR